MAEKPPLLLASATVEILAAADGSKAPRVSILAYSGGMMNVPGWGPIAIDLKAAKPEGKVAILADHDATLNGIVGHGTAIVVNNSVVVNGELTQATDAARKVIELAKGGFSFQASIGFHPTRSEYIRAGDSVSVNGQTLKAPDAGLTLIRAGQLKEVSIVALAADSRTSVAVAASRKGKSNMSTENETVDFTKPEHFPNEMRCAWDRDGLSDGERIEARMAAFKREHGETLPDFGATMVRAGYAGTLSWADAEREILRGECRALRLKQIRAEMPIMGVQAGRGNTAPSGDVLQAAFLHRLGKGELAAKTLGEQAAHRGRELRATHLCDIFKAGLAMEGQAIPLNRDEMIRAAFSTHTITTMLSTAGNKLLLESYTAFPSVARLIARKLTASDFKTHTGYRLAAAASKFEEVGPGGEIPHGSLAQQSYPYSVKTFARMFGLTRQDVINDDLGAFDEMPRLIGRGAAATVEEMFWELVLANTGSFFTGANYISGGTSVLAITGLGLAVAKMRQQTDSEGSPISVVPKYLVVPPELEATADQLFTSANVVLAVDAAAVATTQQPDGNPYKGKYQPLVVPHISNSSYTGYSTTQWYLFGDPADVPAFGIAYLNGQESPTIESSDSDFNTLGLQFRGFLDVGVCQVDGKGAVKSAGA